MKIKLKKTQMQLAKMFNQHQAFVMVAILLFVVAGVVYRISVLSNVEPSQETIDDQVRVVKPVIFKEDAVEKIEALSDSNVKEPGTQVQQNRDNPFAE